jgi:DNA-binding GntR family transcriptional regulator
LLADGRRHHEQGVGAVADGGPLDSLKIQRTSTVDQVAEQLRALILRGELAPGTPLREISLAESMGVARNTVREGIHRLQSEGLVEHRIHRGAVVATLDPQDVREIFEIRRFVEFSALERCSRESIRELSAVASDMVALFPEGDAARLIEADMHFHQVLVDSLGNARVSAFFANTLAELRIALCLMEASDAPIWVPLHVEICQLLAKDDRKGAIKLLADHLEETETLLVATVAESAPA